MSPKSILITFLIVSLLLIGMMFLIVDARINTTVRDFKTLEEEFKKETIVEEKEVAIEKYPKVIQQYNTITEQLLAYIEDLKKDFIAGDNIQEMEAKKNEIFFINNTEVHTEKATQFIARIEAYENIVTVVHSQFPQTKKIAAKLREVLEDTDWLSYNFKDFPTIAIYTKLTAMENDIKTQQKNIFTLVLRTE